MLSFPPIFVLLLAHLIYYLDLSWQIQALCTLPAFLFAGSWDISKWLHRGKNTTQLQILIDCGWIGLIQAWFSISILRELSLGNIPDTGFYLLMMTTCWMFLGQLLCFSARHIHPLPPREQMGIIASCIAVLFIATWKYGDISRPLDRYWYLYGADDPTNDFIPIKPARNWSIKESIGWEEAGAMRLVPNSKNPDLIADKRANGRITLAVRGPVGSYISVLDEKNVVKSSMVAHRFNASQNMTEGPVRRYLDKGVAAISVGIDLQPGEYLGLDVQGDEVYLMPSSDAVWALHAEGQLRYTFHYQILNQVENLVWAQEIQDNRRFTWNQPPGWSPLLSCAMILVYPDMQGAGALFLWVLLLIALSGSRLASLVNPHASSMAYVLPAIYVCSHALLMIEPASFNFPDSLYTAAILGMLIQIIQRKYIAFAVMVFLTQALRWPGSFLGLVFIGLQFYYHRDQHMFKQMIQWLFAIVGITIFIGGIAYLTGDAEDILFILYFETFPEHWHDNYNPKDLLPRIPDFFALWTMYTGGGFMLLLPFLFGNKDSMANNLSHKNTKILFFGIFLYALLLSTIDHHPSHYFLPLVAITAPCLVATSTQLPTTKSQLIYIGLAILGIGVFLWNGVV